jgi:O-antigen/teichoic acid export membrane protein
LAQPKPLSILREERIVGPNVLVAGGTILAGGLGFAFQVVVSHRLRPTDYAAVFAAMTLLTLVALPASALTLLQARETSRDRASGHSAASIALLRSGNRTLLLVGVLLGGLLLIGSPWIGSFFAVPTGFVVAIAAAVPVTLALPLLTGELQGQQRFPPFVLVGTGQALLKLVAAIVLGLVFGPVGVLLGLAVASTITYLVAFGFVRRRLAIRYTQPWLRPAFRYLALVLPSTLALSVLLSADVLLVKHFFTGREAGEYSAVAALGRAVFWGAAGVAAVLFPKVIFNESQGRSGARIVAFSLGLVAVGGVAALAILDVAARPVLTAFAGPGYVGGAYLLPLYAVAMTLLGAGSVLIATHQSRARAGFLAVLLPIAVTEPILIMAFHSTPMQVVSIVTLSMAALLAGLAILMIGQPGRRVSANPIPLVSIAQAKT